MNSFVNCHSTSRVFIPIASGLSAKDLECGAGKIIAIPTGTAPTYVTADPSCNDVVSLDRPRKKYSDTYPSTDWPPKPEEWWK